MKPIKSQKIEMVTVTAFRSWLVILTASLVFFYTFIQMNMINSFSTVLMRDFSINAVQLGNLIAMYFYTNAALVFPAGLLVDRISTRKIILTSMFFSIIAIVGFGLFHSFVLASVSRLISGAAGAFAFLSCIRLASRWFPPKKMAFVTGCVVTLAMLGGTVAQTPMVFLSNILGGWRLATFFIAALGIVIFVAMWFIVHDLPAADVKEPETPKAEQIPEIGFWKSIYMVFANPYNWLAGLYTTLMNLPIFVLGGSWGDLYLTQTHRFITGIEAATISSMVFFGTIFGSPLVGWISDHLRRRILPMIITAILSIGLMLVIMYVKTLGFVPLIVLFFLLGLITSAQVLGYPVIVELNSPKVTGTALSIASLLIMVSGFIFPPLFGYLLGFHWNHLMIHHIPIYAWHDFNLALIGTILIPFIVSVMITFLIKETHCKPAN
ncbi:MAG: MFS transporter [Gammaproteobacteria bacterium]|nr:MFS transporter [Gammaproteobacteria bacterium]